MVFVRCAGWIAFVGLVTMMPAAADMGQVHLSASPVEVSESAQKALILHNGQEEVLILGTELKATGNASVVRFIPFPAEPKVALAPKGTFPSLAGMVKKYGLRYVTAFHSKGGAPTMQQTGVEVTFAERLGEHDLTVIRVRDAAQFRTWANSYFRKKGLTPQKRFAVAEAIVTDYVARGIDYFAIDAVELTAQKRLVDPIAYRFASTSLYYPLKTSNSFGGKGDIELYVVGPTTLCAPGSNIFMDEGDKSFSADGRPTGPCLGLSVKASTSVVLVPEEGDLAVIYPPARGFFQGKPAILQAIRYSGVYHFDNDVMLPMPQGVAKAVGVPPVENRTPWAQHLNDENPRCKAPPARGICKGNFERYYFDQQSRTCRMYSWGGCEGEPPFETMEDCVKTCTGK
jgi:hypothetical protein